MMKTCVSERVRRLPRVWHCYVIALFVDVPEMRQLHCDGRLVEDLRRPGRRPPGRRPFMSAHETERILDAR